MAKNIRLRAEQPSCRATVGEVSGEIEALRWTAKRKRIKLTVLVFVIVSSFSISLEQLTRSSGEHISDPITGDLLGHKLTSNSKGRFIENSSWVHRCQILNCSVAKPACSVQQSQNSFLSSFGKNLLLIKSAGVLYIQVHKRPSRRLPTLPFGSRLRRAFSSLQPR